MPPVYSLNTLERGKIAVVCGLKTEGAMRRRLMDIGLIPGSSVECLFRSCSGDPTAYLIQGAVVALRSEDASTVLVATK